MQRYRAIYSFSYRPAPDFSGPRPAHHPVIVVGAGPIGLATAIDLAQRGHKVVLLDDSDCISEGSRAICFSKRTLEICDRLGIGERLIDKGVVWQVGRVFLEDNPVYRFDLLPEPGHKRPAFINLQQYYFEAYLVERALALPGIDLRWKNRVTGVEPRNDGAVVTVETPDGAYRLACDWLIVCDGARSTVRDMLRLEFEGQVFHDRFLIADVHMTAGFPTERWFWFDPPFNRGQSALLHKQPDDVWRIDLQLGPGVDPEEAKRPENVTPRLRQMLGPDASFDVEWLSVYSFQCKRMERFVHGRIVFAGDAAHQVSPFGARGANSGMEDAQNLAWKLSAVLKGDAPARLVDSYGAEREQAADDNIGHSTRATDFISPKSPIARIFRNAALKLAPHAPFAQRMVNSGRLSTPTVYADSPLNTPDRDDWSGPMRPGAAALDAPLVESGGRQTWLLDALSDGFTLLQQAGADCVPVPDGVAARVIGRDLGDPDGLFARRYDATPGAAYLFRPDQYLCARFRRPEEGDIQAALARALARTH
jgi:3-(3-hydroxy-phenyl)propionate hydroxylase